MRRSPACPHTVRSGSSTGTTRPITRRRRRRRRGQLLDDPDAIRLLIPQLHVLLALVLQEPGQEPEQPLAVEAQDPDHLLALLGVGHEDLEDVEGLVVEHAAVVAEELHGELEVGGGSDVRGHDGVVCAFEQERGEEVDGLPLGYVAVGEDQEAVVVLDEEGEVRVQVVRDELLVLGGEEFLGVCQSASQSARTNFASFSLYRGREGNARKTW